LFSQLAKGRPAIFIALPGALTTDQRVDQNPKVKDTWSSFLYFATNYANSSAGFAFRNPIAHFACRFFTFPAQRVAKGKK
jgi:hypothetical protein